MSSAGPMKVVAIIPARYASERFPGKLIAPLDGKPLVVHTCERTSRASLVQETILATDDERVREAVAPYGIRAVMTRPDHTNGTDRIAEVAATLDADIIVNVQGDEPLIDPATVDATIQPLLDDPTLPMSTVRHRITDLALIDDPNCVKVVCDQRGRALYFSRSTIPHVRGAGPGASRDCYWQHIGLYVFRREFLLEYSQMSPTPLERLEKLEQLRVLEHGYDIAVVETEYRCIGVDTPEDLERARLALAEEVAP